MLLRQCLYFAGVAYEYEVRDFLLQHLVCCYESPFLLSFGEYDALFVSLCACYNLIN